MSIWTTNAAVIFENAHPVPLLDSAAMLRFYPQIPMFGSVSKVLVVTLLNPSLYSLDKPLLVLVPNSKNLFSANMAPNKSSSSPISNISNGL